MLSSTTICPTVLIDGIPVDNVTTAQVAEAVREALLRGEGGHIVTPNMDHLYQAREEAGCRDLLLSADFCVPDGAPLLWVSRLRRTPLRERIAGADLVWALAGAAASAGLPLVLIGGTTESVSDASERFREAIPGLTVIAHSPPFGFESDEAQMDGIGRLLEPHPSGVVLCGLGFPKQEYLAVTLRRSHPGYWYLGCGAAIDMVGGRARRAPSWVQRLGFEWLYRLGQEPRRLFRRYLVQDLPLAVRLISGALRDRYTSHSRPTTEPEEPS